MPPFSSDVNRPKGRSLKPLRALWPFIRPYKGTLVAAMVSLLLASGAFLLTPIAVRYVIDFLRNRDAFAYNSESSEAGYRYLPPPERIDPAPPSQLAGD